MKDFKVILLTALMVIGFVFPSCEKVTDSCDGIDVSDFRFFDIQGADALVFQHSPTGGFELVEPLDTIVFRENTGLYVSYQADYHALRSSRDASFGWVASAMACSFIGGYDGSKNERLDGLTVVTENDYDAEHPAGSSIVDLLEVQFELPNDTQPLNDYLANQTETIQSQVLQLNLLRAPASDGAFQFTIQVDLSTGEQYEATSAPVYIRL